MSRDLNMMIAQRLGVLCDPDVMVYTLTPNDCYLLIATDGVWDGMSSQEAITLVEQFAMTHQANASEASKHLNREALAALDRRQIDDNVSNVCVFITYQ
jgi:serine/threonine protein phosphatase PrpC